MCVCVYVFDGSRAMGTGGAVRKALPELGDRFFGFSSRDVNQAVLVGFAILVMGLSLAISETTRSTRAS